MYRVGKLLHYKTTYVVFMLVSIFLLFVCMYRPTPVVVKWMPTVDVSCHSKVESDLRTLDRSFSPDPRSIFFHETSCKGGLNSRQACAVESAARTHPDRDIYVFFSSPISNYVLERSNLFVLQNYDNINFVRIIISSFVKGTPVQNLVDNDALNASKWKVEYISDVLRYITLYKWPGVYLDTDTIVVKSLDSLPPNWAGKEDNSMINSAALALSNNDIGRKVAEATISDLKKNDRKDIWNNNGPGVITRVLKNLCNTTDLSQMATKACKGFTVYEPKYFYPIHWTESEKYFEAGRELNRQDVYIYHMWNRLTREIKIPLDSPYAKLAKIYCPSIYELYADEFGI